MFLTTFLLLTCVCCLPAFQAAVPSRAHRDLQPVLLLQGLLGLLWVSSSRKWLWAGAAWGALCWPRPVRVPAAQGS